MKYKDAKTQRVQQDQDHRIAAEDSSAQNFEFVVHDGMSLAIDTVKETLEVNGVRLKVIKLKNIVISLRNSEMKKYDQMTKNLVSRLFKEVNEKNG